MVAQAGLLTLLDTRYGEWREILLGFLFFSFYDTISIRMIERKWGSEMIEILLVDDQKILLEGLKKIFEPASDITVCATCALAELAEEACRRYRPDLVLMDICMESRTSGIRICRRLKERFPQLRVVMMTGMSELAFIGWAKDAGADSFIYKEASGDAFLACIRRTMVGEHIFPQIQGRDTFGASEANLTERELEILQLICRSMSREEIAERLDISKRTVGFHIGNMLAKTGYKSIVGLAVEAAEKGLTSMEAQKEREREGNDTLAP